MLFFPFLFFSFLSAAHETAPKDQTIFSRRPLIIFFDSSENIRELLDNNRENSQAFTLQLYSALIDKAAPILVSSSLLHNFLSRKIIFHDFITLNLVDLTKKYNNYPLFQAREIQQMQKECADILSKSHLSPIFGSEFNELLSKETLYTNLFLAYAIPFTAKEWVVRQRGDFYLLIPRDYMRNWAPSYTADKLIASAKLEPEELELGLQFQHSRSMPDSFFETFVDLVPVEQTPEKFLQLLPYIFISAPAYQKILKKDSYLRIPLWHIYLGGHGSRTKSNIHAIEFGLRQERAQLQERIDELIELKAETCIAVVRAVERGLEIPATPPECKNPQIKKVFEQAFWHALVIRDKRAAALGVIAGMPVPYFTQLTQFLNSVIATRFLFICSCYAAGENLQEPYKLSGKPFELNYTVASQAVTEEVTYTITSHVGLYLKLKHPKNKFMVAPAFESFFDILLKSVPVSAESKKLFNPFIDAAAYAAGFFDQSGQVIDPIKRKFAINNLVWLRVPGTTWFSFATFRERTFVINRRLVAKYAAERLRTPVEITKKSLILLEADTINFPLKINSYNNYLPQIVSIMSGSATHRFAERVTIMGGLEDFVNMILRQETVQRARAAQPVKQFYIKFLVCKNVLVTRSYRDVLIIKNNLEQNEVYNAVYFFDESTDKRLSVVWDITKSTFKKTKLVEISDASWTKILNNFNTLESTLKKKFALIFKDYNYLESGYKAALKSTQKRIELIPIIKKYGEYLTSNQAQAELLLKKLPTQQQRLLRRIFAPNEIDFGQLADLELRLRALASLA